MQNQLKCPLCEEQFAFDNLPRLLVVCGHTFCHSCISKMITEKNGQYIIICPEDGEAVSVKGSNVNSIPKNLALIKILSKKDKDKDKSDSSDLQVSKIGKRQSKIHDDQFARQIVDVISNSTLQKRADKQQSTKYQIQMENSMMEYEKLEKCKSHQKPLEVVCIRDLKKICVSCAIFGQHKGHEFKSLDQIESQSSNYYSEILKIMERKEKMLSQITNQKTRKLIIELLENKKQKMRTSIMEKFKKLHQAIQLKEKQTLKNLDTLMNKSQLKIKNLMKINPQISQKYDIWEQKSYNQIKILEGSSFQSKLNLLFVDYDEADVLDEGDKIIEEMKQHGENLITEVQLMIENIGLDFCSQIYNYIDNFVEIYDEVKKKKSKIRTTPKIETQNFPFPIQNNNIKQFWSPKKDDILHSEQANESRQLRTSKSSIFFVQPKVTPSPPSKKNILERQQNLLDQEEDSIVKKPEFIKTSELSLAKTPEKNNRIKRDMISPSSKFFKPPNGIEQQTPRNSKNINTPFSTKKDEASILEKPNKKKLLRLKLPEKVERMIDSLINDQTQTFDLTNAQLGDNSIVLISEFLLGSKAKIVKFIRNKLTDDAIPKILPFCRGVLTLNLSQNLLTDRVLDILIENRSEMQSIKSVILSQNKIMERKVKAKVQKLKSLDLLISL